MIIVFICEGEYDQFHMPFLEIFFLLIYILNSYDFSRHALLVILSWKKRWPIHISFLTKPFLFLNITPLILHLHAYPFATRITSHQ